MSVVFHLCIQWVKNHFQRNCLFPTARAGASV